MDKNSKFKSELETQYTILIKSEEEKQKRRNIIILVILSITLLSTLICLGFSFKAYKESKKVSNINKTEQKIFYDTLITTFNNGKNINLTEIGNGYELKTPKTIQISNEGNEVIKVNVKLTSIKTTLLSTNNLVYTITKNNETSSAKELPLNDTNIINEVEIKPEETINYIINVKYTGSMEENNYNNYYSANIDVEQINNKTNLLE